MVARSLDFVKTAETAMPDESAIPAASPADESNARIDQIADAALKLFARYGYKRSSMDDIAREAGLAKATLYLHFKGKDDVFRAMLRLLARRVEARCREVTAKPGPFGERLAALLHAHHGQIFCGFGTGEHLPELKAVMSTVAATELAAFEEIFATYAGDLLRQAEAKGEISLKASGLTSERWIACILFAAGGAKLGTTPDSGEYGRRLADIAAVFAASVAA
jgi:AcrR family transcriptional regulator